VFTLLLIQKYASQHMNFNDGSVCLMEKGHKASCYENI
jgi:hypothetical protein